MDVERPDGRDVQHGLGQNEAVGGDDQRVGAEPGERGAVGFVLEVERLEDRNAELLRQHLDGGRLEFAFRARRGGRAGNRRRRPRSRAMPPHVGAPAAKSGVPMNTTRIFCSGAAIYFT